MRHLGGKNRALILIPILLVIALVFFLLPQNKRLLTAPKTSCEKIISLAPSVTELIYFIGEGNRLIANTIYCDYPEEARSLPKIGGIIDTDIEKVVSLKPDLVIASYSGNSKEKVERLQALGINVITLRADKVEDIIENVETLGEILNVDVSAQKKELRDKLRIANLKNSRKLQKHGVYLVSTDPIYLASANSFIGSALYIAGFDNPVKTEIHYPIIDREGILKLAPKYVVLPRYLTADEENTRRIFGGDTVFIYVDEDSISRPSHRVFDVILRLCEFE